MADLTTGERLEERIDLRIEGRAPEPTDLPAPGPAATPSAVEKAKPAGAAGEEPTPLPQRTPETGDRRVDGRFTHPGAGVPDSQRRLNARGRGEGDRRKIAAKAVGLADDAPAVWPHEVDEEGAEKKTVPVAKLVLTRGHLVRGRIARAEKAVTAGLRNEKRDDQDDLKPILVVPHPDGSDRYAVVRGRGEHRVAAAHLANPRGDVPVVVGKCAACAAKSVEIEAAKQLDSTAGRGAEWRKPAGVDDAEARSDREKKRQREMDRLAHLIGRGAAAAKKPSQRGSRILPKLRQAQRRAGGGTQEMKTKIREIHEGFAATGESYGTTRTSHIRKAESGGNDMPAAWVADEDIWEKAKTAAKKTYDEDNAAFWPAVATIYEKMGGKKKSPAKKDDAVKVEKREMGLSSSELRSKIAEAVRTKIGAGAYIVEVYPDTQYVVVEKGYGGYGASPGESTTKLCRIEYEIGDDDEIALGDPEDVELDYVPKATTKSVTRSVVKQYVAEPREDAGMTHVIRELEPGEALELQKALAGNVTSQSCTSPDETEFFFESTNKRGVGKTMLVKAAVTVEEEVEDEAGEDGDVPFLKSGGDFLSGTDELEKAAKKGLLTAIVYSPSDPEKPEPDLQGEWATAEDIEEAAHNYLEKTGGRIKIQHGKSAPQERVVASWIQPNDWQIGKKLVKAGTWLMTIKLSEETKKLFDSGKLRGLSMGGSCAMA